MQHCNLPVHDAHPCPDGECESTPHAGLTRDQKFKLEVMEHRGKIAASITAAIAAILVVMFHGVGY